MVLRLVLRYDFAVGSAIWFCDMVLRLVLRYGSAIWFCDWLCYVGSAMSVLQNGSAIGSAMLVLR
jgi:hypothetical protein